MGVGVGGEGGGGDGGVSQQAAGAHKDLCCAACFLKLGCSTSHAYTTRTLPKIRQQRRRGRERGRGKRAERLHAHIKTSLARDVCAYRNTHRNVTHKYHHTCQHL